MSPHDLGLESHLAAALRALVAPDAPYAADYPLAGPVSSILPVDELGTPADRMTLAAPLALWFGYADESPAGAIGEGTAQRWAQDWWVIVAARHVGRAPDLNLLRDLAGPARTRVRLALSGWTPDRTVWSPLVRVAPGVSPVYLVGYTEFPLKFRTLVRLSAPASRNRPI